MSIRRSTDVFVILSLFMAASAWANDSETPSEPIVTGQCISGLETAEAGVKFDSVDNQLPLSISAQKVRGNQQGKLTFDGDVQVTRGQHQLTADQASMDRTTQTLDATGEVVYHSPNMQVSSTGLSANTEDGTILMTDSQYQMLNAPTHGSAKSIAIDQNDKQFTLKEGNFTTCPPGDESWLLTADEIKLDGNSEWGEAHNSVVRLGNVPVFWMPYMTFPLSDKRKSGLLFPNISNSSRNGLDFKQPYYWSIAPNIDATFTPRYIGNSGTQIGTELRYLRAEQYNQFNLEFLPSDDATSSDDDRYLYRWLHQGRFTDNIRSYVEYTQVSDDNYFNDLGSDVASDTDNRLERTGQLSYLSEQFDSNITVTDYKIFGSSSDVYRQFPRIDLTYRVPYLNEWVNAEIFAEYNNFTHTDNDEVTAQRFHLEPRLSYNWHSPAAEFEAEAKLYQTYYVQDSSSDEYSSSVNRTIPSLRLFGQLNFERSVDWFNSTYTQRLEPQFQYLVIGHQEQSDIGTYDTVALREDVHSLYRDRRFSGIDRIADTNQITLGATTRLFNKHNEETFRFSFGQIFYFEDSKVVEQISEQSTKETSAFATSLDTYFDDYSLHAEYRYNFKKSETDASSILLNYTPDDRKLIQFSYRYSPEPLDYTNETGDPLDGREIHQLGSVVSWPINERYQFVASHYRDTDLNRSVESLAGVQYQSCCWAVRLVYQRNLNTNFPDEDETTTDRDAYDSGVALQFELKGLGGNQDFSGQSSIIDKSIFGYRRNYYLNN